MFHHRPVPYRIRPRRLLMPAVCIAVMASNAKAQWVATPRQTFGGDFSGSGSPLLNLAGYERASLYETLWRNPAGGGADSLGVARMRHLIQDGGLRLPVQVQTVAPEFARLVPEIATMLDWGYEFQGALLGAFAAGRPPADRDGRVAELVSRYRTRADLAVSAIPKGFDLLDGQPHSLEFRQRWPMSNGLGWAVRWAEKATLERLVVDTGGVAGTSGDTAVRARLVRMAISPDSAPFVLPIAPGIAPAFAQRYPEAAAIVDNLHMLEDGIADVLVARDIPRSARRLELLRLRDAYRNDTVGALTVAQWRSGVEMIGPNNMGGPAVDFPLALATPTVQRGASMAGMSAHDMSGMGAPSMTAESAAAPMGPGPTLAAMMAIHRRMMADPVIRERVATDPALQKMLRDAGLDSTSATAGGMAGMDHGNMPGMAMTPQRAATMLSGTAEQRAQAMDFIVRLLSDPAVEARIHSSPELHGLWSDPEVQKRLGELKRHPPGKPPVR